MTDHARPTTTRDLPDFAVRAVMPARGSVRGVRPDFDRFCAIHRFGALDGLRALSAIAVVWHHTVDTQGPVIAGREYFAFGLHSVGGEGVDLFFAISGFLITTLLVREYNATARISLRKFYARRSLRIFPLYYLTLLVCIATTLVKPAWRDSPVDVRFVHYLPAFVTYTPNWFLDSGDKFFSAWSLATEEQFYLLWPPLLVGALAIGRGRVWIPLAVVSALVVISQSSVLVADTSVLPGRIPASLSLPILLGAAAALVASAPRGFALLAFVFGRSWSAPAVALALAIVLEVVAQQELFQSLIVAVVVRCLMVAVVVSVCLVERTSLHPLLQWRPLAFVGVISYGVYLLHPLCINAIREVLHQNYGPLLFAEALVSVVVLAYLSFRYFETPLLRLKRRFETKDQSEGDELTRITGNKDQGRGRES